MTTSTQAPARITSRPDPATGRGPARPAAAVRRRAGDVPIAALMVLAARAVLVETARRSGRFDIAGAVTATLGMGALVFAVIESADAGWASTRALAALVIGVGLVAWLVVNEAKAHQPIMPLWLFASRERSGAYAVRMLYLGAMIGFFYFTTQLMQDGLGFTPLQAGLGFLPMSLVNFAVAAPMVLIGAGQGLAFAPLTSLGIAGVEPDDAGAASGLLNTAHQFGMALGLGVLVTVSAGAGSVTGAPDAVAEHVRAALTGGSVLLAAALLAVFVVLVPTIGTVRRVPSPTPTTVECTS